MKIIIKILLSVPFLLWSNLVVAQEPSDPNAEESEETSESDPNETIVVTGSRTEQLIEKSPVPITVITKEDIEAYGPGDVSLLLQQMSGIQITNSVLGSSLQIQGLEPEHILILIDGQRVLGEKDGVIDISRLSLNNIERIEIVRGPSSVLYGSNAMGGVINIITSDVEEPLYGSSNLLYSPVGEQFDISSGTKQQWGSVLISFNARNQDAFDLDPSDIDTNGPQTNQMNGDIKSTFVKGKHRLTTQAGYLRRDSQRVSSTAAGAIFDQMNRTEDLRTQLTSVTLLDASKITANVQWSFYKDQFLFDQRNATAEDKFQETTQRLTSAGFQQDLVRERHLLTYGLESYFEVLTSDRLDNGTSDRLRPSIFIQEQWSPAEDVTFVVGNRLDYDSWFGYFNSPKVAVNYQADPSFIVRASSGMGYRAPAFKEMFLYWNNSGAGYMVTGNPDLQPETMVGTNVGFTYIPTSFLTVNTNFFRNDLTNLITANIIESESDLMEFQYQNILAAYTQGVEVDAKFDVYFVQLQPKYTFTDAWEKVESDLFNKEERALVGRPRHTGSLSALIRNNIGTQLMTAINMVGHRTFLTDINGDQELDNILSLPFTMMNFRIQQEFPRYGTNLVLGGNNLLNAGDPRFTPLQPRWFFLKLGGEFPIMEQR